METELYHYGTPRHSGRYPWGSGENPYQHGSADFLAYANKLKSEGLSDVEIAKAMGISTTTLRERRSIAKDELHAAKAAEALRLKDKGYSNIKIGEIMGINESSVRSLLNPVITQRANITAKTAEVLREAVDKKKYVDIGNGTEAYLGISRTKLKTAVQLLEDEGYKVQYVQVDQLGTNYKTSIQVLCAPGTDYKELYSHRDQISLVTDHYTNDGGKTWANIKPPQSIDSSRLMVRYGDEGGKDMDGTILLRRGVEDISLGDARYAQVRIMVDGTHYLKGMAMYSDDLPKGIDLLFNTNKTKEDCGGEKLKALKAIKDDSDNPFGATVRQREYIGSDGKVHLSAINVVGSLKTANEEGSWGEWSKSISSQVLSKQPVPLAKKQLNLAYDQKKSEFETIMALTNPAVKKKLLESFSDDCDASATHLDAAGLPRQRWHVILPFPNMKEDEIYAPNYKDGETVVLIRYPHGGRFEIPTLRVNNHQPDALKAIQNAKDAVGINAKVAERLSGADFDGDTVLVIPNNSGAIKTSPRLDALKDFDPKEHYRAYDGMPKVGAGTGFHKQAEMGQVSNLITDMTIKGATPEEIARAVRHSMVVIDAEKHNLNWRQSAVDNGIAQLKEKYQGGANRGASTIVSRASSPKVVPHRKQRTSIDPETGAKIYYPSGETYINREGRVVERTTRSTKMAEAKDAYDLSSGTPMENVYADYANRMKSLGNEARKALLATPLQKYNPSARKTYQAEVDSLNSKLNEALKNAPLERQAQLQANIQVAAKRKANPEMDNEEVSRLKSQALSAARSRNGASKSKILITDREWEAIQAGAISNNQLVRILNNTDMDRIKQLATPRSSSGLTTSQLSRAKSLLQNGYTQAEVASQLGISTSTLLNALSKKGESSCLQC